MRLIERLDRWIAQRRGLVVAPKDSALATIPEVNFGVSVNNNTALKITALYAGIRIRSENIASFPKYVKRQTAEGLIDEPRHPAYSVINVKPNRYTNKFDFWNCICTWLDGWGNAYAIIERGPWGDPVALHQVHPSNVQVTVSNGRKWYRVTMADPNLSFLNGTYSDENILHFMLVTLDGVKGVNPIIYNAMSLSKNLATEKFASEFYERGGNIKAVMETEGHFGDDEYNNFMSHFIQSETLSIQDVCRIINIPPHMVAELSHATFSNIEHQTIQFVQYSLRPTVKRLESELENKLFTGSEAGTYSVKFALDGLLRGDTQARSAYYHNAILDITNKI